MLRVCRPAFSGFSASRGGGFCVPRARNGRNPSHLFRNEKAPPSQISRRRDLCGARHGRIGRRRMRNAAGIWSGAALNAARRKSAACRFPALRPEDGDGAGKLPPRAEPFNHLDGSGRPGEKLPRVSGAAGGLRTIPPCRPPDGGTPLDLQDGQPFRKRRLPGAPPGRGGRLTSVSSCPEDCPAAAVGRFGSRPDPAIALFPRT